MLREKERVYESVKSSNIRNKMLYLCCAYNVVLKLPGKETTNWTVDVVKREY